MAEDNYSQFLHRERRNEARLKRKPVCCYCGRPIQDENLFDIDGLLYHEECANERYRKYTEDYIA